MKIISWNVNGLRATRKKDFDASMKQAEPDILCLQETKAQNDEVLAELGEWNNFHIHINSADKKGYSGTAILSRIEPIGVSYDMGVTDHDSEGRVITAEFADYYLVNTYVPNSGRGLVRLDYRQSWDTDFLSFLKNLEKKKPVILTGDLNVAHRPIDLANDKSNYNKSAGYTQVEIDGFQNLLDAGWVDSFRHLHPDTIAYTYWNYMFKARERNVGWRIDYFVVSNRLVPKINASYMLPHVMGSDHCPIVLELK